MSWTGFNVGTMKACLTLTESDKSESASPGEVDRRSFRWHPIGQLENAEGFPQGKTYKLVSNAQCTQPTSSTSTFRWFEGLTGLCWFLLYGLWVPPKTCKITTTKKGPVSCQLTV